PLRSYRPAPIIPSTSLSISNCSTASATARRKSPSLAFSSSSARTNLSSVIGSSRVLQVEVWQLHLSRPGPMATSTTPQPYTADRPENSTTSVDANLSVAPARTMASQLQGGHLSSRCLRDLMRQLECHLLVLLECWQGLQCKLFEVNATARARLLLEKIYRLVVIRDHPLHVLLVKGLAV